MTEPGQRVYTILDIDMESAIAAGQRQPVNQTMLATLAARFSLAASGTGSASGWAPPWLPIGLASSTADLARKLYRLPLRRFNRSWRAARPHEPPDKYRGP